MNAPSAPQQTLARQAIAQTQAGPKGEAEFAAALRLRQQRNARWLNNLFPFLRGVNGL